MSAQVLPLRVDLPRYSIRAELDGVRYEFAFEWNDRAASWSFNVLTIEGDPIVSGVRVVVGYPLLDRYRDPRLPPGVLTAIDSEDLDRDPGPNDLGARVELVYFPASEIPAEILAAREARL